LEYKEIIEYHLKKAEEKFNSAKTEFERMYWKKIGNMLLSDFRNYQTINKWKETGMIDLEKIFEQFFRGGSMFGKG